MVGIDFQGVFGYYNQAANLFLARTLNQQSQMLPVELLRPSPPISDGNLASEGERRCAAGPLV